MKAAIRGFATSAIVSVALLLSGCGTIAARMSNSNEGIYPAMSIDRFGIVTGGGNWDNDHPSGASRLTGWLILTPFWIADLPISFVSDTIMLPLDVRRRSIADQEQAKR